MDFLHKNKKKIGFFLITLITIFVIIAVFTQGPISQDLKYHLFADPRTVLGTPNFWNVISNLPFLIVGIIGLYKILHANKLDIPEDFKAAYLLLFSSLCLVGFGSGYYHLSPTNETLVWDRLPMTIGFMSLFTIIIYEFISRVFAAKMLIPSIAIGFVSVLYWHLTEQKGTGDLRLYLLIQFLPVFLTPVILIFFHSQHKKSSGYWWLLVFYIAAKLVEAYDQQVYDVLGLTSGHTLKHLFAALGFYILLLSYEKYRGITNTPT